MGVSTSKGVCLKLGTHHEIIRLILDPISSSDNPGESHDCLMVLMIIWSECNHRGQMSTHSVDCHVDWKIGKRPDWRWKHNKSRGSNNNSNNTSVYVYPVKHTTAMYQPTTEQQPRPTLSPLCLPYFFACLSCVWTPEISSVKNRDSDWPLMPASCLVLTEPWPILSFSQASWLLPDPFYPLSPGICPRFLAYPAPRSST